MTATAVTVTEIAARVDLLRAEQAIARYPELLGGPWNESTLYQRDREGTDLTVVAIRHAALSPAQAAALSEFRMQQYVLWGWYDLRILSESQFRTDPAFTRLPSDALHVLAGTRDGCLLAYFCMTPAVGMTPAGAEVGDDAPTGLPVAISTPTMSDPRRPL